MRPPISPGERLTFASPLPPDLEAVIKGEMALTSQ
jgi:hypothetical protein